MKSFLELYIATAIMGACTAIPAWLGGVAWARGWTFVAVWLFLFAAYDATTTAVGLAANRMGK